MDIPPLYTPFDPAIHPEYEAIDQQTARWAREFGIGDRDLRERLVDHDIGVFAARILPEGCREVVQIVGDFVLWLFGVDDGHCEEGPLGTRPGELAMMLARLLRVAQNPEIPTLRDDSLAAGLRDLRRRIDRYATPVQSARWVDALREYFLSVVCEAHHRSRHTVPGLDDYTLMRLYDGAASVVLPLLEIGHGYELRPHERDATAVRALSEMACFVISWDNDILSQRKEAQDGYDCLNVQRVLQHEQGLTPHQALTAAISHRDRVLQLFVRLREHLVPAASSELRQYLSSLGCFIRAAQDWEATSPRYVVPGSVPTTFRDEPAGTCTDPVPIPVIEWWWDLLPTPVTTTARCATPS